MKYTMYYGGKKILPPDNIRQIYHGARLIWERASELAADTTLQFYRFTKNGLLCPSIISRGTDKKAKFFNVHGQNIFTVSFSNFLDESESAGFLWSDTPLYGVNVLNDGAIVESETAWYIEGGETAESFICHTFAPELTDTEEQWGSIFSRMSNYLSAHPNRPNFNGGGGMIPLHFPMGYIEGAEQAETVSRPPMLAYIKDGKLVTDTGYAVLAVCGESMVCAESAYISGSGPNAYGKITERALDGTYIRDLMSSNQRIINYTSAEKARRFYMAGDYVTYYSIHNSKQYLTVKPKTATSTLYNQDGYHNSTLDTIPENVFYYGGYYYLLRRRSTDKIGFLFRGKTPEDARNFDYEWTAENGIPALGDYDIAPDYGNEPGQYWLDEANGVLYAIGQSTEKDSNGRYDYKIIHLQLEEAGGEA